MSVSNYDKRGFREHKYIGIYGEKSIRGIGEIKNIIAADLENENLIIHYSQKLVSEEQKNKIKELIAYVGATKGWDITHGLYFFCVEKFEQTDFKKAATAAPSASTSPSSTSSSPFSPKRWATSSPKSAPGRSKSRKRCGARRRRLTGRWIRESRFRIYT